jgi:hypothetical protein
VSSAETIDLERNSADAIASATTSSVLLPHHNAVGACCETSSQPCGEELRCVSRISQPELTNSTVNPSNFVKLPASAVTSAASVFGGGPFLELHSEDPKNNHVETESTPDILWMSREKRYMLYFTPIPAEPKE